MAGVFPAGFGPAGLVPAWIPGVQPAPFTPRAVFYDPKTRQYELTDPNGNPFDVHPVDQMVATRLTSEQGQSKSNLTLGTRIRALIANAAPDKHQQIATQEVTSVLADLIGAGDVLLISVFAVRNPSNLAVEFPITYRNLRAPNSPASPVTISL